MSRTALISFSKDAHRLSEIHRERAFYWGHICSAAAKLANSLAIDDKSLSRYLIDLSAKAGKQSAQANALRVEADLLIERIQSRLRISDSFIPLSQFRDEQAQSEEAYHAPTI